MNMLLITIMIPAFLFAEDTKPVPKVAEPELDLATQLEVMGALTEVQQKKDAYNREMAQHMGPLEADIHRSEGGADAAVNSAVAKCNAKGGDLTIMVANRKVLCVQKPKTAPNGPTIPPTTAPTPPVTLPKDSK